MPFTKSASYITAPFRMIKGTDGANVGVRLMFLTSTTDADPGTGKFRLNNSTIALATAAFIDNAELGGASITGFLDSFDDSLATIKGVMTVAGITNSNKFALFNVTGTVVDGTGYRKVTINYISGAGTWVNDELFSISFARYGKDGVFSGGEADRLVKSTDKVGLISGGTPYMPQARKAAPWPLFNALEDGGRFAGMENNAGSITVGAFDAGTFLGDYNGSSKVSGGLYVDNSSTYGGTGAAINTDLQGLMTAAGFTGANEKYHSGFYAALITAGGGTAVQQTGSSPARYLSHVPLGGVSMRRATVGYWVKCLTGKIGFQRPGSSTAHEVNSDLLLNGVSQGAAQVALTSADGWNQLTFVRDVGINTYSDNRLSSPFLCHGYAEPLSTYLIALPWLFPGVFFPEPTELPFMVHSLASRRI